MPNTENLHKEVATFGQNCLEKFPVIILGSGASIPYGLPSMENLKAEIDGILLPEELKSKEPSLDKLEEMQNYRLIA